MTSTAIPADEFETKEAHEVHLKDIETMFTKVDSHFTLSSHVKNDDSDNNDKNKKYDEIVKLALEISRYLLNEEVDNKAVNVVGENFQSIQEMRLKLESLGHVLYFVLSGKRLGDPQTFKSVNLSDDVDQEHDRRHSMKSRREKKFTIFETLSCLGVPASLCSMISALVGTNDEGMTYRYENIVEVMHDLEAMISDPQLFLFDAGVPNITGRLEFPSNRIFGRAKETKQLYEIYERVFRSSSRKSEIALVYGYPGVGKSSMVHQIEKMVTDSGGYFLAGKFEQLTNPNPLSAMVSIFNTYCELLLQRRPSNFDTISAEIRSALGSECKVLTDLIPRLHEVVGEPNAPENVEISMVVNRRNHLLRLFLNVISSHGPIVLFLDDLQRADSETLATLQTLVSIRNDSPVLFIGCYRENEVDDDHPLIFYIQHAIQYKTPLTKIKLRNFDKDETNNLLSKTLCIPPTMTRPLAAIVCRKTSGNPMFVIEFMKSIFETKLLTFSLKKRRWDWDLNQIETRKVANNVVELLKNKMRKLPQLVQETMKIAACLGFESKESVYGHISSLLDVEKAVFLENLNLAVDEGFLDHFDSKYRFVHDQIESAAYALIPEDLRPSLHLKIGKLILSSSKADGVDSTLCEAVSQMNRGFSILKSKEEKIDLAKLNLKAGKISSTTRSYSAAWYFFREGLNLLDDDDWQNNYHLILELTNFSLESAYIFGDYKSLEEKVLVVITKSTNFNDQLRAYYTSVKALGSSFKMMEALSAALTVLEQLDAPMPFTIDEADLRRERHLTGLALDGFSEKDLPNLPEVTDEKTIMVVKFMNRIFHISFFLDCFEVIVLRFIRLSLAKGVCSDSAFGFSCYGFVLCMSGNYAKGSRFGEIARKLISRFKMTVTLPMVIAVNTGFIYVWNDPIELHLQSLLDAVEMSMLLGDTQYAAILLTTYILLSLICGSKLGPLYHQMKAFMDIILETKQELFYTIIRFNYEAVEQLVEKDKTADAICMENQEKQSKLSPMILSTPILVCCANSVNLMMNYLFGRYVDAQKNLITCHNNGVGTMHTHQEIPIVFWGCLNTLALARKTQKNERLKLIKQAKNYIEKMKDWSSNCQWNFEHKYHLMKAELFWTENDIKSALIKFDTASRIASKHRHIRDGAVIHERAGLLEKNLNNLNSAKKHFVRAEELFLEWGSPAKANHTATHLL